MRFSRQITSISSGGYSSRLFLLFLVCLSGQVASQAQTSDETRREQVLKRSKEFNKAMQEEVAMPTLVRPFDESIFALAAASKTNFFCDVTEVPATLAVKSFPGTTRTIESVVADPTKLKSNLWLQLSDMMEQSGMANLQLAPRTILLWHAPEPVQVSREIVGDWQRIQPSLLSEPLGYKDLSAAWKNYFRDLGWDGKSMDMDIQVKFADLPVEAQRRVLFETWKNLFWDSDWNPYDDGLWAQSGVRVGETVIIGKEKVEPYLSVLTQKQERTESWAGIAQGIYGGEIPIGPISAAQGELGGESVASEELLTPITVPISPADAGGKIQQPLSETSMRADAALAKTVSVEIKRASLGNVLRELSQQSGIALTPLISAQDSLNSRQFVVKTGELALSDTMIALSHLTGAVWTHETAGYVLHGTNEDALSFHLRQIGDLYLYRIREGTPEKIIAKFRRAPALIRDVLQSSDLKALQSDLGVPIGQLAPKTQNQLRRYAQEEVARHLIFQSLMERDFLGPQGDGKLENEPEKELILHLRQEKQDFRINWYPKLSAVGYASNSIPASQGPDLTLTLRRPDGELISSLFPEIRWIDPPPAPRK